MIWLLFWAFWLGVGVVIFPFATRVVYHRERDKYTNPLLAYRDAIVLGAGLGLFWPVALPVMILMFSGAAVARVAAPPEVKRIISQHNTRMLERSLGMKDEHEYILETLEKD